MKTELELEQNIINITTTIHKKFPELSKYIMEMPENNSAKNSVNVKSLEEYYQSLEELVNNYANTHKPMKANKNTETPK